LAINVCVLCWFFLAVGNRVGQSARRLRNISGIQTQCDIKMAEMVTKQYKAESWAIFLELRRRIWAAQFIILIITQLIQYPTPLLKQIKDLKKGDHKTQVFIDQLTLWLFYLGLYKETTSLRVTGIVLLGLIIERVAINWLKNRFGCTYFKLQKFIELDQRREALRYRWDVVNPTYSVAAYKRHYFLNDFEEIKERMKYHTYKDLLDARKAHRDQAK